MVQLVLSLDQLSMLPSFLVHFVFCLFEWECCRDIAISFVDKGLDKAKLSL